MTRLNNIYTGSTTSNRHTTKESCYIQGNLFEVPNGKLGWYPKMVYRFVDQLEVMLTHSRCVMAVRFDLRMTGYSESNKIMTIFWRRLGKRLGKKYGSLKLGYIWAREQERAKQQHYHVVMLVDKDTIHYSGIVTDAVIETWRRITDLQAHIPKNPYYIVKPDDWKSFSRVLERMTYLAKFRGKGYRPAQTKDFGSSRIKPLNNGGFIHA